MQIMQTIKSHPYMTGAIVIGGGLAFFFLSGWFTGGSSGGQVIVDGWPSDAEIASSTQLALAQISAGVANNQIGAELGATSMATDLGKLQASLAAQLGLAQIDAGRTVSLADIGAGSAAYNTGAAVELAGINASANIEQAKINASTQTTAMIIDALKPKEQAPVQVVAPTPVTPTGTTQYDDYVRINPDLWQHTLRVAASVGANPYDEAFQAQVGQQHWAQYGQYEQDQGRYVPVG